jgi:hypothetical protein
MRRGWCSFAWFRRAPQSHCEAESAVQSSAVSHSPADPQTTLKIARWPSFSPFPGRLFRQGFAASTTRTNAETFPESMPFAIAKSFTSNLGKIAPNEGRLHGSADSRPIVRDDAPHNSGERKRSACAVGAPPLSISGAVNSAPPRQPLRTAPIPAI